MQNVLPLFQRGMAFDRLVLVGSEVNGRVNPKYARIAQDIADALGERVACEMWPHPVDPINPHSTLSVCKQIAQHHGGPDQVTINFTGGLKPMSIGAYLAGLEIGCHMLYVDTQTEQIHVFTGREIQAISFDLENITIRTMLRLHGHPIDEKVTAALSNPAFEDLANAMLDNWPQSIPQVIQLQRKLNKVKHTPNGEFVLRTYNENKLAWFFAAVERNHLLRRAGSLLYVANPVLKFIQGGWLEAYACAILKRCDRFMDVAANVKVAGVENELDIACSLNGKLGIIECKSGQIKGQEGQAYLNRLRVLKESLGGSFGRTVLVTALPKGSLSTEVERRAREYVARLIYLEELPEIGKIIAGELSIKSRHEEERPYVRNPNA